MKIIHDRVLYPVYAFLFSAPTLAQIKARLRAKDAELCVKADHAWLQRGY